MICRERLYSSGEVMEDIKHGKVVVFLDFYLGFGVKFGYHVASKIDYEAHANVWPKNSHVRLVIYQFALLFFAIHRAELATARRVPRRIAGGFLEHETGAKNDKKSGLHHHLINHAWVAFKFKISFFVDVAKAC